MYWVDMAVAVVLLSFEFETAVFDFGWNVGYFRWPLGVSHCLSQGKGDFRLQVAVMVHEQ